MKRNVIVILAVTAAVAVMLMAARQMARQDGGGFRRAAGDLRGMAAPDFTLKTLDGREVTLSGLRGKAVVVNFWATWCAPCKIEMPWLADLQKKHGPHGVEIIGVTMDESPDVDAIKKFVADVGANYTIVLGNDKVGDAYGGVQFLPTTVYIDRQGKVTEQSFGIVGQDEIEKHILTAMGSAPEDHSAHDNHEHAPADKPAEAKQ
jgi:thiol-disulfide isomerase/thioredoxin